MSDPRFFQAVIYMVRHGIYDRDTSATDDRVSNGLNALGHEQARLAGERLARLPVKFDRLISSEFLRGIGVRDAAIAASDAAAMPTLPTAAD